MSMSTDRLADAVRSALGAFMTGDKKLVVEKSGEYRYGGTHIYVKDNK